MQETGHVADGFGGALALQHAQKYRLEDVFGVAGIAGDAVGGAKHHGVVLAEDLLQVVDGEFGRFISGGSH